LDLARTPQSPTALNTSHLPRSATFDRLDERRIQTLLGMRNSELRVDVVTRRIQHSQRLLLRSPKMLPIGDGNSDAAEAAG
jgi:hypothetical protein